MDFAAMSPDTKQFYAHSRRRGALRNGLWTRWFKSSLMMKIARSNVTIASVMLLVTVSSILLLCVKLEWSYLVSATHILLVHCADMSIAVAR